MDNKARNQILLVLFIGVLMGALDIAIVGPALPAIQAAFKVDDRAITWIFTIYVLFNLIGTPLMAKLSDIFGRRSIYVVDVVLFALGSLIAALSPTFSMLLIGRAVQGLGAGGIFPVASAVIGDTFPADKRGSALGMIGAVFGLAFIVGPILGAIILITLSWQWLFVVNLPIAAIVIVLSLRTLPTTRPATHPRFDWLGMVTLGAHLALLTYAINQIDTNNFVASVLSANVLPYALIAAILLAVFILIERRAADPVLRLSLYTSRQTLLASVLAAGAGLGEAGLVFVPALAVVGLGVPKSESSFLAMPVVLALLVGSPTVGKLLDKFGSKVVVLAGSALLAIGMLMLNLFATNMILFIVAGAIIGLGLSALLGAPIRYIMLNEVPASDRAAAQGLITLNGSIGQLLSGALVGAVAASMGGGVQGYSASFLVIGLVAVALTVLTLGLKNRATELATVKERAQASAAPAH